MKTAEIIFEELNNVFEQLYVEVPRAVIDWVHRIGKQWIVKWRNFHQIILLFTTGDKRPHYNELGQGIPTIRSR